MAVNKNFVVKNGLEVNDDLILANAVDSMVGIGTSVPYYELHVQGGIGATSLWVAGVSTFTSDVSVAGVTTLASAVTHYLLVLRLVVMMILHLYPSKQHQLQVITNL